MKHPKWYLYFPAWTRKENLQISLANFEPKTENLNYYMNKLRTLTNFLVLANKHQLYDSATFRTMSGMLSVLVLFRFLLPPTLGITGNISKR